MKTVIFIIFNHYWGNLKNHTIVERKNQKSVTLFDILLLLRYLDILFLFLTNEMCEVKYEFFSFFTNNTFTYLMNVC